MHSREQAYTQFLPFLFFKRFSPRLEVKEQFLAVMYGL